MAATGRPERRTRRSPERGVSEFAGVAILVAFTILLTGSAGLFVLVDPGSENAGPNANFSYQYVDRSSVLIVTHDRGDTVTAGNLTLRGNDESVTWAALANTENATAVGPGTTVQLSRQSAYGRPVPADSNVSVVYSPPAGNETVLDTWDGSR